MRRIVISDGEGASVTLLPELEYTVTAEEIGASATMASGREAFDLVGEKNALNIPTGWPYADELVILRDMIRRKHILYIRYDVPEGERTDRFLVKQPSVKSFRYGESGVTVWYGVTLTATQYEVTV